MNHEEIARRVSRVHLTRCPYCGFDFLDIPPKPGVQFRCFGCSAYISQDMLVDDVSMDNFEGDGEKNLCPHCGWHWESAAAAPGECPGCLVHVEREEMLSEREFAGLDRAYVEVTEVDNKRKNRQAFLLIFGVVFVLWMFYSGTFLHGCAA